MPRENRRRRRSDSDADPAIAALDVREIAARLPHRFPFLLVDRVLELEAGKRLVAIKNVTIDEPFFTGHFPGRPIMPGVLICEALVQAGGLLAASSVDDLRGVVLAGLEKARFRKPVEPGDQLRLEVELLHERRPLWRMRGVALVDGQRVAEAEFLTMEVDETLPGTS